MGTSHYAKLVYGYHLGAEESLELAEVKADPDGYLRTSWYDYATTMNDDFEKIEGTLDPLEAITKRLFDSIPDGPICEWDWQRADAVKEHLGVWLEPHCNVDYPMWILATAAPTVSYGDVEAIDPAAFAEAPAAGGWDAKLAHALAVLELTPVQKAPAWLLCADRG